MKQPLFLFLFFISFTATAQLASLSSPLVLTHISDENGLSDNRVTCVYKDKQELLWIGTKDGLNLVDGSIIRVFKNNAADSNSILNNFISGITEDDNGTIWISTGGGLCHYNKKQNTFTAIRSTDKSIGETGGISNAVADKNNCIWFGSGRGLYQYNSRTGTLILHFNKSTSFETDTRYSNQINHTIIASDNTLYLATSDGLWNFSPLTNAFVKIIHKQNDAFYHPLCQYVYEDHEKNIWAGFWNSGLKKFIPATGRFIDHGGPLQHSYGVSSINEATLSGGKKIIWISGQLFVFDESSNSYSHLQQPANEKELPDVSPVYRSADGWVWLASDNGLYIYNPQQQVFTHQLFDRAITSQGICFKEYKNGILSGAQAKDFLKWKDENGKMLKDFSALCQNDAAALCIEQDKKDEYWIGSTNGILHTNLISGASKWYRHKDGDSTTIPRDFITFLLADRENNLWIFPWRQGIWQMDKQTGKCTKLWDGFINESGKLKKLVINDAKEDENGNIWMADLDEGIILYDAKTNTFSKPFERSIGAMIHTSRIFIQNGKIYAATSASILRWTPNDRTPEQFFLPAELNKGINDIYPDNIGNWWLTTPNGLVVFNEQKKTFQRFTSADGLFENNIGGNLFCTPNNTMIIGAPEYFSYFNPAQLSNASASRKNIQLTAFIAGNRVINADTNKTISLGPGEKNITIRWALPAYGNPFRNQYYYQLEGIDPSWRYAGNKGEIQYANLSAGRYTILLKAATANETESGNTIRLRFFIHPPFWKTWWFILLLILTVSALFFVAVRYISQRNLKEKLLRLEKEQAIDKERNRISRDMHDDLGSGLTKIAILSEVVKKQMHEPEKARQQLDNISQSSRELVDNLQDIIWVLNPKNDTLENLAAYIREYGLKFFEPFGISVHFHYPDNFRVLKLSEETRRNIFLVIKETFNNIVKHAWCNNVEVSIETGTSSVSITIKDDGKGFDKETTRQFGNGLINMKSRIEQIGGAYSIDPNPGKGTTSIIDIKT